VGPDAGECGVAHHRRGDENAEDYAAGARQWTVPWDNHGGQWGEAYAFSAGDITVGGPHLFNSSGGKLGNGRTRAAMWADCIEQLRGTAGPRQVRGRAETAPRWRLAHVQQVPQLNQAT